LAAAGVSVEEIDTVVLSHLHFDHAGGATCLDEEGALVPTFPNAEYVVQRSEWVSATAGYPELRGVYSQDNILPLAEAGVLRLIDGDVEIVPGISAIVTGGHTVGHAAIRIESQGQTAIYLGDLCPTRRHLPSLWGMGYDVDMLQVRRKKRELLGMIAEQGWLALFDHDPDHVAAYLKSNDEQAISVVESFETL
jgi:glyoxylase-like metal-dependent hydrolase (beta-lactamase superfamily II)